MKQILLEGDRGLISQLLRFHLFNEEFATLIKIDLSSLTGNNNRSDSLQWIWKPSGFKYAKPGKIAYNLADDSLYKFLRVPFDD